ncbi:hypothetical protein BOX15_Mlig019363g1 [Macrostomum lignano]|uniref:Uncharacterized protein n=1 Tax=Macrostomum lignano TaxID=282301 RepID=A0A267E4S7_9PLAT|nr:hypothetical protein BOX15_Mlig019363g3 [Macrostomum lignano]PAA56573.1 hypothetical protein BOX15_Mlig019363g1 [Macrostomum lignano]
MAGFARLHDSMANLYLGKPTSPLNPISETPSKSPGNSRTFDSTASSERKHPAPGGSRNRLCVSDSDEERDKNASFMSYQPRSSASSAGLRRDENTIEDSADKKRPGSPRPTGSSLARRSRNAEQKSSQNLPTRSVDGASSSRSLSRPTAGDGKQARHYDSTDNMRLGVKDDSSSENSDARLSRTRDKPNWSSSRRQADTNKSEFDIPPRSSRLGSSLLDKSSSLTRGGNLDSKLSDDDSPPARSSLRDETSIRRRKEIGVTDRDRDIPMRRRSPRAALEPENRDDSASPTLRSTAQKGSFEEPLKKWKESPSLSSKDSIPARRKKIMEDDYDSPSSRSAARDKPRLSLTSGRRDQSPPPSRLSPRNESSPRRRNDTDERSGSLPFNRRRDLSGKNSDSEELPSRRRTDRDFRSGSPPLKSSFRDEPLNRRRDNNSKTEMEDLQRESPNDRSESPPSRFRQDESLVRRKPIKDDKDDLKRRGSTNKDTDDSEPQASDYPRRRPAPGLRSGASSPPLQSSLGNNLSPRRSSYARDSATSQRQTGLLLSSKSRYKGSDDESPLPKREDGLSLRRSRNLATRDMSPPLSTSMPAYRTGDSLSPRRQDDLKDDDRKKREEAGSWPKSGYRPGLQRKEGLQSNETPGPKSKFQGDKEQPKSGTFKRAVTTPKQASLEKKKPLRVETSDSETESSSGTKGFKREPIKSPVRPKPAGKDGRSLSPPSRSFSKSSRDELSPRSAKGLDLAQPKAGTASKRLDGRKQEPESTKKGLSPRASSKDDSRSPRSSVLSDSKSNKKEPSYLRSGPKAGPNSTRDLSPPRTAEKKSYGFKSSFRMSDKDKDSENRASKGPTEFEFSRYETHSLRVVKLKRPLPANLAGTRYALVETAARLIGFVRTNKDDFKTPFLIWNDTFISMERLTQLKPFQRVNHFPGMAEICRKDLLAKNMGKLNQRYPSEYKFAPRTWCLPDQLANFRQHTQEQKSEVKPSYICKPVDGTSGRGIKIYKTAEEVPQTVESQCVLQEYVSNPFLIENVKFDLRLYVLVSSCDPLRIYLFNDGFIRMSSEPYVDPQKCKADEDLNFIHLTNCSVNKQNRPTDTYGAASRRRGAKVSGMKRPLMFLNSYLQQNKYDVALVWRRIVDLIIKTVFAAYPHVVRSYRQCRPTESPGSGSACFELLGFDILLDTDLKPWLMEVNRSPSFDYDNSEEEKVKLQLLQETLMLLNFSPADWKAAKQTADSPEVPAKTAQKEVTELTALLARLKRQDRMKDVDTRICQRFRCIFPVDDATKQEKLVSVMLDAISALLEGSQMEALHREVKTFNASKTDEVAKKLAQLGSKTVQQLMDDGQAGSSGSDSEIDDQAAGGRRKPAAGRLPLKDGPKKSLRKSQEKQKDPAQKQPHPSESMMANEREQLAQRTLKFLNELSIRFPGKSNRAAEQMLRQLQDNWLARKADVSSYWRLSLDADKRRKVIDIARQNVRIALDKALRMTASDVAAAADNLASLFEKLYNRLLWCHGQGLWETFAGNTGWELILRQSREAPTETEINCCRRVVQLCQDGLMVVYLFSDAAQQLQQQQQQQQASEQLPLKASLAVL